MNKGKGWGWVGGRLYHRGVENMGALWGQLNMPLRGLNISPTEGICFTYVWKCLTMTCFLEPYSFPIKIEFLFMWNTLIVIVMKKAAPTYPLLFSWLWLPCHLHWVTKERALLPSFHNAASSLSNSMTSTSFLYAQSLAKNPLKGCPQGQVQEEDEGYRVRYRCLWRAGRRWRLPVGSLWERRQQLGRGGRRCL